MSVLITYDIDGDNDSEFKRQLLGSSFSDIFNNKSLPKSTLVTSNKTANQVLLTANLLAQNQGSKIQVFAVCTTSDQQCL